MSWKIFEDEVSQKMEAGFKTPDEFSKYFTQKYEECVKRGVDIFTLNTVKSGNKDLMEALIFLALLSASTNPTPAAYDVYFNMLGDAVVGYWMGAELTPVMIPLIPAPGSISNVGVINNIVTNPGVWPKAKVPPMKNTKKFLKVFSSFAKMHLMTLQGVCQTISVYPPVSATAPGFVQWQGFKVIEPKSKYIKVNTNVYILANIESKVKFEIEKGKEIFETKISKEWSYIKDNDGNSGFVKKETITDKKP